MEISGVLRTIFGAKLLDCFDDMLAILKLARDIVFIQNKPLCLLT